MPKVIVPKVLSAVKQKTANLFAKFKKRISKRNIIIETEKPLYRIRYRGFNGGELGI